MAETPRPRGLPAIEQAREARLQKPRWPAPKYWGWAALVLMAMGIFHWKNEQSKVEGARQALLARQRAVEVELGPRWKPLRDRMEGWTMELAGDAKPDVVEKDEIARFGFREAPGIYLRLPLSRAKAAESIRDAAKESLRDGFTSCLFRVPNPDPFAGAACRHTRDCPPGQLCNEVDHCAPPAQPYNLRVGYRAMRVLDDVWMRDIEAADGDLRVRVLTESFDDLVKDDIPVAIELLTRAKYFLVVVDEAEITQPDGGVAAIDAEPHFARVALYRLSDGKLLLRVRREASAELVGAQGGLEQRTADARQRQANACALALEVRRAMGDDSAATMPPP